MKSVLKIKPVVYGIIAFAIVARLTSSTSPAIAVIQKAFPQANHTAVESLATIGDAAAVLSALVVGQLLARWSFKQLGLISLTLLAGGGLLPLIWHQSVTQLLIWGFLAGLGTGGITTILPSLQSFSFQGEQLAIILGKVVALENGSSMVLVFIGGLLASRNWLYNYYIFFLTFLAIIVVWFTVPNQRPQSPSNSAPTMQQTPMSVMRPRQILMVIFYIFVASIIVFLEATLYNKNALFINNYHLGSPALTGQIMMLDGLAAIVVGLTIKYLRRWLKKYLLVFSFTLDALGGLLLLKWHSVLSIGLATFCMGAGSAIVLMTVPYLLSLLASPKRYPLIMGCFSAITSLGFSSSAVIFNNLVPLFTKNLLGGTYLLVLVIAVVMIILLTGLNLVQLSRDFLLN